LQSSSPDEVVPVPTEEEEVHLPCPCAGQILIIDSIIFSRILPEKANSLAKICILSKSHD